MRLLDGVRVVDLTDESGQLAGRALADLGADVTLVEPVGGSPVRSLPPFGPDGASLRFEALNTGKTVVTGPRDDLVAAADVVLAHAPPAGEPTGAWVVITPWGIDGPRATWRGGDLTCIAASGNLYATGDPDRAPIRCAEPTAYAHVAGEATVAALFALWSGVPQVVDVSIQETMLIASQTAPARWPTEGIRGKRKGAVTGRTREIWRCADGYVSFGLRGGRARVRNLETISRLALEAGAPGADAMVARDWTAYLHTTATREELAAITETVAAYFEPRTMRELFALAVDTGLMLAPANSPREIHDWAQLQARDVFDDRGLPQRLFPPHPPSRTETTSREAPHAPERSRDVVSVRRGGGGVWAGTKIVEFGSGAAGPIALRYFTDHGATVVRVESATRPDFIRVYAMGPKNPHGLEGSPFFANINAGKLGVTLNMKDPRGVDIARRLVGWADGVLENFAPKAMAGWGMTWADLSPDHPGLVMVSACLLGQTGPQKDYPGFGGQGAALSGYNYLTGWPDREPLGPNGTITDSLAPRFAAAGLAAGLLHRQRTGQGCYVDLSQVEVALWTLGPWLLDHGVNGHVGERSGNRTERAAPHGAFPCLDEGDVDDRWVAIAVWDDDGWARLCDVIGLDDPSLGILAARKEREDEVEKILGAWTSTRTRRDVAETLQSRGIDAYEVLDWADVHDDPQLRHRRHFVTVEHPVLGEHLYEENGFRLSATPGGVSRPGPTLGQHNDHVLGDLLGLDRGEVSDLAAAGVLS